MFLQAVEMFRKHRALSVHLVTVCVMFQEVREAPNLISQLEEEPEREDSHLTNHKPCQSLPEVYPHFETRQTQIQSAGLRCPPVSQQQTNHSVLWSLTRLTL